jgi:hypothetical protein
MERRTRRSLTALTRDRHRNAGSATSICALICAVDDNHGDAA